MTKLEQAAREVIRQHSMECLSDKTVDALREALAEQAEQEPVVDPYNGDDGPGFDYKFHEKLKAGLHLMSFGEQKLWNAGWDAAKAFYTAPVRTKNLKDDEIARLMNKHGFTDTNNDINLFNLVYDIVAADRKLNGVQTR